MRIINNSKIQQYTIFSTINYKKIKSISLLFSRKFYFILLVQLLFNQKIQAVNSTNYNCLSLSLSSVCTEWPNNYVSISSKWTVAMLDADLKNRKDSTWYIKDFNNNYGCFWNGKGLQYLYTFSCFRMIFEKENDCNSINRGIEQNRSGVIPICKTTCEAYYNSLKTIFNNEKQCPSSTKSYVSLLKKNDNKKIIENTEDELFSLNESYISQALIARSRTLQDISDYCKEYSTDDNCINDVVDERNFCGFSPHSFNNFLDYCSKHKDADCCKNKMNDIPFSKFLRLNLSIWSIVCISIQIPLMIIIFGFLHYKNRRLEKYMDPKLLNPDGLATFNRHFVIHSYDPVIEDEIELNSDDDILIQEVFNDGWVHGINCTTNTEGTFPVACISPYKLKNFNETSSAS